MNEMVLPVRSEMPLAQLRAQAVHALEQMEATINLFRAHNTDAQDVMVVAMEYTPGRKLRQIAAELQRRQAALVEAGANVRLRQAKARAAREEAQACKTDAKREVLLARAERLEAMVAMAERPYRGALEGVLRLQRLHDQVYGQMKKRYGDVTADVIEKEEARYWIMRIFAHCLRDIRGMGRIHDGRQSVLARMGFDPGAVAIMLVEWLNLRRQMPGPGIEHEEKFLADCADRFEDKVRPRLQDIEFGG